ncbi:MAG: DUF3108 domain-containing protein [Saprospiraceae bacterium]|nr:DUF3108 domain-containing protein [Saprospiraceae bacterium]
MKIRTWQISVSIALLTLSTAFDFPANRQTISSSAQENLQITVNNQCETRNTVFRSGEELTYKVFYNWNFVWLSAGEVTFRVREVNGEYHLSAHGSTYKSYDWFFKVRDKYDTYVDKKTLLPRVSIRDVQEGKYRLYDEVSFDRGMSKATSLRGKTKDVATTTDYTVNPCVHDILSIVYYARNLDFKNMKAGQNFPINIFIDKEEWPLKVSYQGKEENKKIKGMGRFNTVKFSPEVIEGYVFKKDARMTIWATDDENRMPLMIESPVSVGSVKIVLKNYKNLRYPMKAKVGEDDGLEEEE